MKRKIITNYLFSDLFTRFKVFFRTEEIHESKFLYDIAFGFMPRSFDPVNNYDKLLFDEEDEVSEMYFGIEGKVGVGFTLNGRRLDSKQYKIGKYFKKYFLLCDHYVLNNKRCEFLYLVMSPVKCFALSKKFIHKQIFPKYPEIAS